MRKNSLSFFFSLIAFILAFFLPKSIKELGKEKRETVEYDIVEEKEALEFEKKE